MIPSTLGFLACTVAILWAGTRLAHYADIIAHRSGLGHVWAGTMLLALTTSLPELFNGISAGAQNLPDIAVGCVAGSNLFNLAILGCLDWYCRQETCLRQLHRFHSRTVFYVILMSGLAIVGILLGAQLPVFCRVSPISIVMIAIYFILLRGARGTADDWIPSASTEQMVKLSAAVFRFLLLAAVVITAAVLLPGFASRLATATGLGDTFIGATLVAAVTSLPEAVTAIAAVRMGAMEMAAGDILGSNVFNLTITGFADLAHRQGSLYAGARQEHIITLVAGIIVVALFLLVLRNTPRRRFLRLTWFGWVALLSWLGVSFLLYVRR